MIILYHQTKPILLQKVMNTKIFTKEFLRPNDTGHSIQNPQTVAWILNPFTHTCAKVSRDCYQKRKKGILKKQKKSSVSFDLQCTPDTPVQPTTLILKKGYNKPRRSADIKVLEISPQDQNQTRHKIVTTPQQNCLLTQQSSETVSSSPLDEMDLIDIILKDSIHRELKSVIVKSDCLDGNLSPVNEAEEIKLAPQETLSKENGNDKILLFTEDMMNQLRIKSFTCLSVDGAQAQVYYLFKSDSVIGIFDKFMVVDEYDFITDTWKADQHKSCMVKAPYGVLFANFVFSDGVSADILRKLNLNNDAVFMGFLDVGKESIKLECYNTQTFEPIVFDFV